MKTAPVAPNHFIYGAWASRVGTQPGKLARAWVADLKQLGSRSLLETIEADYIANHARLVALG